MPLSAQGFHNYFHIFCVKSENIQTLYINEMVYGDIFSFTRYIRHKVLVTHTKNNHEHNICPLELLYCY